MGLGAAQRDGVNGNTAGHDGSGLAEGEGCS